MKDTADGPGIVPGIFNRMAGMAIDGVRCRAAENEAAIDVKREACYRKQWNSFYRGSHPRIRGSSPFLPVRALHQVSLRLPGCSSLGAYFRRRLESSSWAWCWRCSASVMLNTAAPRSNKAGVRQNTGCPAYPRQQRHPPPVHAMASSGVIQYRCHWAGPVELGRCNKASGGRLR